MAQAIQMVGGGRRWLTWVASVALNGLRRVATLFGGAAVRPSPAKSRSAEKQRRKEIRRKLGV